MPSVEGLFVRVLLRRWMADLGFIGWRRPSLESIALRACVDDTLRSLPVSMRAARMQTWRSSRRCGALSQGMFVAHSFQTLARAAVIPL